MRERRGEKAGKIKRREEIQESQTELLRVGKDIHTLNIDKAQLIRIYTGSHWGLLSYLIFCVLLSQGSVAGQHKCTCWRSVVCSGYSRRMSYQGRLLQSAKETEDH